MLSSAIYFSNRIEDYEILDLLGTGGFARVNRAIYRPNGMEVAIKMIDINKIKERAMMDRVRQEVDIHNRVEHPSILCLYTFFEDSKYIYLVLELCKNGDLQSYVSQIGRFSEEKAAPLFLQVVQGLLYLHNHKIIHRDISLKNILVTTNMEAKIADFGLATQLNKNDERHMTMCGTPNFISPEVATGSSHGLQTDVWSLGCMLYTLLVGKAPFEAGTVKGTLSKVIKRTYTFPLYLSENAKDLIHKMLQKNQEDRITLRSILEHPFVTFKTCKMQDRYASISNSGTDSGLGRTLSSYGKNNFRSHSEERSKALLTNGHNSYNQIENKHLSNVKKNYDNYSYKNQTSEPVLRNACEKYSFDCNNQISVNSEPVMNRIQTYQMKYSSNNQNSINSEPAMGTKTTCSVNDKYSSWCNDKNSLLYGIKPRNQRYITPLAEETSWHKNENLSQPILKYQNINVKEKENLKQKLKKEMVPLNLKRLQPTRHRASNVICTISEKEEVFVEFIKKKNNTDKVYEVCRISGDGLEITIYNLPKSQEIGSEPPVIVENKAEKYRFDNLPSCHYKKYIYAARFVNIVRAKSAKIIIYTDKSKCLYMENEPNPNFNMYFYDDVEISQVSGKVKLKSKADGRLYTEEEIPMRFEEYIEHYKHCYERCVLLESSLNYLEKTTGFSYFPAQIGRKPPSVLKNAPSAQGKENITQNPLSPPTMSTFNGTCSMFSNITSQTKLSPDNKLPDSKISRTNIPDIGIVMQFPNGITRIDCDDGSIITLKPDGRIIYIGTNGSVTEHNSVTNLPLNIQDKLKKLSQLFGHLVQSTCKSIR